jgi:PAS domain S-box-containing protein
MSDLGERVDTIARLLDEGVSVNGNAPNVADELRESLKALHVAEDDLRKQNDELSLARGRLQSERERYRELFDFAPDAYLVTDMRGVIRDANVAAEELLERPSGKLIGKPVRLFVPVDEKTPFYSMLRELTQTGRVAAQELVVRATPGKEVHLSVSARTYPQSGAPAQEIRWQLRDSTERLAREAQIRRMNVELEDRVRERTTELTHANAVKDEFLGLISHELKTPIAVISGNAEVLVRRGEGLDPEQRAAALADVHEEAGRLHRIIDNMLVLARLEQGNQIRSEPLRLDLLVKHEAEAHARHFPRRAIEVDVAARLVVDAAPVYVEQVVRNLLANAQKYTPAGETIGISLATDSDEAIVRIADRGGGVPEDELGHLFTAFYRSPRTAAGSPGVGIGLAVCKRLIEAQHGRVWAERRDGGGMEFGFSLPLAADSTEDTD